MSQIKKLLIPLLILTLLYTSLPGMALAAGSGVSVSYNGSNDSAVVSAIRTAMVDREAEATVTYTKSMGTYRSKSALNSAVSEDLDAFTDQCLGYVKQALAETGNPQEGDYLLWSAYGGYSLSGSSTVSATTSISGGAPAYSGTAVFTVTYAFSYHTTAAQEAKVTSKVNELIKGFGFTSSTTDYAKFMTIYDFVCCHVSYDHTHVSDSAYTLKYTAYNALFGADGNYSTGGEAVCQGYAALLYRLLREAGVSARIIAGTGTASSGAEPHAWNIARMDDGYYYNADSTWDAGRSVYQYCLLCDKSILADHSRSSDYDPATGGIYENYTSAAFYSSYPMGSSDYSPAASTAPGTSAGSSAARPSTAVSTPSTALVPSTGDSTGSTTGAANNNHTGTRDSGSSAAEEENSTVEKNGSSGESIPTAAEDSSGTEEDIPVTENSLPEESGTTVIEDSTRTEENAADDAAPRTGLSSIVWMVGGSLTLLLLAASFLVLLRHKKRR